MFYFGSIDIYYYRLSGEQTGFFTINSALPLSYATAEKRLDLGVKWLSGNPAPHTHT